MSVEAYEAALLAYAELDLSALGGVIDHYLQDHPSDPLHLAPALVNFLRHIEDPVTD